MCLNKATKISIDEALTVYKVLRVTPSYTLLQRQQLKASDAARNNLRYRAPYHYYFEYKINEMAYSSLVKTFPCYEDKRYFDVMDALHSFTTLADAETLAYYLSNDENTVSGFSVSVFVIARCTIPKNVNAIYKGKFYADPFKLHGAESYATNKLKIEEVYPEVYYSSMKYDTIEELLDGKN